MNVSHVVNLLQPMVALMGLTLLVWLYMYWLRLSFVARKRIAPQQLSSFEQINQQLPERINRPAHNLKNLFELPVLFYGLCIAIEVIGVTDTVYLYLAWGFVVGRCVHSSIQCSNNWVTGRFVTYMLSSVLLWLMLLRFAVQVFYSIGN